MRKCKVGDKVIIIKPLSNEEGECNTSTKVGDRAVIESYWGDNDPTVGIDKSDYCVYKDCLMLDNGNWKDRYSK